MSSRTSWIVCVVFGAGVIAFIVWFTGVVPTRTCNGPLPPGETALLEYQLSRTPAEIEAVFGAAGDPCRESMVATMNRANTVDLFGFIATYNAFLAFFFVALLPSGAARAGLFAVAVALVFDVIETSTQLRITAALPGSAASLGILTVASRGKFFALAIVCWCAGAAMILRGRAVAWVGGAATIVGGILVVVGLLNAPSRPLLSTGNAIAWLVMLVYAAMAAMRRSD